MNGDCAGGRRGDEPGIVKDGGSRDKGGYCAVETGTEGEWVGSR